MISPVVMVVDDDLAILEVVEIVLKEEGYSVITDTGPKVLKMIAQNQPDVLLLDIWMNGIDGRDIARAVKRDYPKVCVILMSAHSSAKSTVQETGAEEFLEKPFEVDDLLASIARYV